MCIFLGIYCINLSNITLCALSPLANHPFLNKWGQWQEMSSVKHHLHPVNGVSCVSCITHEGHCVWDGPPIDCQFSRWITKKTAKFHIIDGRWSILQKAEQCLRFQTHVARTILCSFSNNGYHLQQFIQIITGRTFSPIPVPIASFSLRNEFLPDSD